LEATQPPKKLPQKKLKRERELKAARVGDLTCKAPSRTPSNIENSDDSSSVSDSNSDSNSSDEDVKDGDDPAKKATKKRTKAKKKKAKKLLKKMIKKEQAKYTHSNFYKVPHNYAQILGNNSNEKFYSVHLRKPPHFMGKDYSKWAYDMQMHLYGLHPSLWKIVVVGVSIPTEGEALTIEHEQDLHRNVQATRVITGSLCALQQGAEHPNCQGDLGHTQGSCRMDLPGRTTSMGTRTDYSVGAWDYLICAARYLMA
jgi:hypothetical protein